MGVSHFHISEGIFIFLQLVAGECPFVDGLCVFWVDGDGLVAENLCWLPITTVEIAVAHVEQQDRTYLNHFLALELSGPVELVGVQHLQSTCVLLDGLCEILVFKFKVSLSLQSICLLQPFIEDINLHGSLFHVFTFKFQWLTIYLILSAFRDI